ncbi:unnamed protein product [Ectocarpus sp. 13 AM-2016]
MTIRCRSLRVLLMCVHVYSQTNIPRSSSITTNSIAVTWHRQGNQDHGKRIYPSVLDLRKPQKSGILEEWERDKTYRIRGRLAAPLLPRRLNGPIRYAPNQSSTIAYEAEVLTNKPAHRITRANETQRVHAISTPRLKLTIVSYSQRSLQADSSFFTQPKAEISCSFY